MKLLKFTDLELKDLGHEIEIGGMILQGKGKTYAVMFPTSELDHPELVQMDHEDWKKLLYQVDTLETILFPNKPHEAKVVVRKSQRNIEQTVSWNVFRRDDYTCQYCASKTSVLTVDHIVLWEDMGASVEDNLITACRKCNKIRGNMDYEDWLKTDFIKKHLANNWVDAMKQLTKLNLAWTIAKQVPLRQSVRNR